MPRSRRGSVRKLRTGYCGRADVLSPTRNDQSTSGWVERGRNIQLGAIGAHACGVQRDRLEVAQEMPPSGIFPRHVGVTTDPLTAGTLQKPFPRSPVREVPFGVVGLLLHASREVTCCHLRRAKERRELRSAP